MSGRNSLLYIDSGDDTIPPSSQWWNLSRIVRALRTTKVLVSILVGIFAICFFAVLGVAVQDGESSSRAPVNLNDASLTSDPNYGWTIRDTQC